MTEQEFRSFIEKRFNLKEDIQEMLDRSSAAHLQKQAAGRGESITKAQAEKLSTLLRNDIVTNISMYENGTATKEEVLNYRRKNLPPDIF